MQSGRAHNAWRGVFTGQKLALKRNIPVHKSRDMSSGSFQGVHAALSSARDAKYAKQLSLRLEERTFRTISSVTFPLPFGLRER
jgi:hypothetical protein